MSAQLTLASSSPFRQSLLAKLEVPFNALSPDIDETAIDGETPQALVQRLAEQKAKAGATLTDSNTLIIGSDQVAVIDGKILGKPHTHENAVKQLSASSGKRVTFYTGLALYNKSTQTMQSEVEAFIVEFRDLTPMQIEAYLRKEQPYYCAGSFMCEGLGIALFNRLEGRDPNTLIGLPLILLSEMLRNQGIEVLS